MSVIYVNSTLPMQDPLPLGGALSPLHFWGYRPGKEDVLIRHRWNRYEIRLRYWMGGLDLWMFLRTFFLLLGGKRRIYLVTQPDLIQAIPLLSRLFPSLCVVTWVWTAEEVGRWLPGLRCCRRVLCLSDAALEAMKDRGLGRHASIGIWGTSPELYRNPGKTGPVHDFFFFGVANRDLETLQEAVRQSPFVLTVTDRAAKSLPGLNGEKLQRSGSTETMEELIGVLWKSRVVIVPLHPGDLYPTGFTNVTEASLCGCAVVLADSTSIPREALTSPGIFFYQAGNPGDLCRVLERALAASREDGFRQKVRVWAETALNGRKLEMEILQGLGVEDC